VEFEEYRRELSAVRGDEAVCMVMGGIVKGPPLTSNPHEATCAVSAERRRGRRFLSALAARERSEQAKGAPSQKCHQHFCERRKPAKKLAQTAIPFGRKA